MMGVTYKLDGVTVTMAGYVSGFSAATTRTIEWTVPINESNTTLWYWCHFHTGQGNSISVGDQTWTAIGGATSASYTTAATTYADDHRDQYRCKIDAVGASSSAYTNAVDTYSFKNIFYYITTIKRNCKRRCNCIILSYHKFK
ncbi:MAG: hypothetical protein CM15mV21_0350 [Eurybiavirus sp.]|nr:MAG: hypothetical protein CM15mV21_0350 [Eurybiavirus sp.]